MDDYVKPEAKNFESVDSSYFDTNSNVLYMFQSTLNKCHPIKGNGLKTTLKLLNLLDDFNNGKIKVKFVFVIPKQISNLFKIQAITSSGLSINHYSITIPRIGEQRKKKLEDKGYTTDQDVYNAYKNGTCEDFKSMKKLIENWITQVDKSVISTELMEKFQNLEQFYIDLSL